MSSDVRKPAKMVGIFRFGRLGMILGREKLCLAWGYKFCVLAKWATLKKSHSLAPGGVGEWLSV